MKRIIDDRATGKTSRLFLLAKENDGIIVCHNPEAMRQKAFGYGIVGIDFMGYAEYLTKIMDIEKPVYIDEFSSFWKSFDKNFAGYTESRDD